MQEWWACHCEDLQRNLGEAELLIDWYQKQLQEHWGRAQHAFCISYGVCLSVSGSKNTGECETTKHSGGLLAK